MFDKYGISESDYINSETGDLTDLKATKNQKEFDFLQMVVGINKEILKENDEAVSVNVATIFITVLLAITPTITINIEPNPRSAREHGKSAGPALKNNSLNVVRIMCCKIISCK